jgi:hypothetical protein
MNSNIGYTEKDTATQFRQMYNTANDLAKRECKDIKDNTKRNSSINMKRKDFLRMMMDLAGVKSIDEGCGISDFK